MPALAIDPRASVPPTPLQEQLCRIEQAITAQQEEQAAIRQRLHDRLESGDDDAFDALDHAADLALSLQSLYRRELDLLGRLIAVPGPRATPAATEPDTRERLRRVTASIARRKEEARLNERRIEELRARDDPAVYDAIAGPERLRAPLVSSARAPAAGAPRWLDRERPPGREGSAPPRSGTARCGEMPEATRPRHGRARRRPREPSASGRRQTAAPPPAARTRPGGCWRSRRPPERSAPSPSPAPSLRASTATPRRRAPRGCATRPASRGSAPLLEEEVGDGARPIPCPCTLDPAGARSSSGRRRSLSTSCRASRRSRRARITQTCASSWTRSNALRYRG